MSMGSEWSNRGSDWFEQARILAGLGQSEAEIMASLQAAFPGESAATLAVAAGTAYASHQRATSFMGGGAVGTVGAAAGESPTAVPLVPITVDVTFTFTHPGTGMSRHGFIRCTLPPGATMTDVRQCIQDFMNDLVRQYGDRFPPVFADPAVVGLIESTT